MRERPIAELHPDHLGLVLAAQAELGIDLVVVLEPLDRQMYVYRSDFYERHKPPVCSAECGVIYHSVHALAYVGPALIENRRERKKA